MANNIYIGAGLKWKSSPAANTIYVTAGLSPDNDISSFSGDIDSTLSIVSTTEGTFIPLRTGSVSSELSIISSLSGTYTQPAIYNGNLNSSINVSTITLNGTYKIDAEMNSTISITFNISGSYIIYGGLNSSIGITSSTSGIYSAPGINQGNLNSNINLSCTLNGSFICSGNVSSQIVTNLTCSGSYIPAFIYGNIDTNIVISGSIVGGYTGVLNSIRIEPSSATVKFNKSKQFTATGLDINGKILPIQPDFNWNVSGGGTINNGLFTANEIVGIFTITASYIDIEDNATVKVRKNNGLYYKTNIDLSIGFNKDYKYY